MPKLIVSPSISKLRPELVQTLQLNHSCLREGIYSTSALSAFDECKRKFWLRYGEGIQPKLRGDDATDFGTAAHDVFERISLGHSLEEIIKYITETYATLLPLTDDKRSLTTLIRLATTYCTEVRPFMPGKCLDTEIEGAALIEVPEVGTSFVSIFRIDRTWELNNSLFLRDWKTSSVYGPTYFSEFDLNDQINSYLVGYENATGVTPTGMFIDVLRVTKDSIKAKRGDTSGVVV